jgi:hypothetical protein
VAIVNKLSITNFWTGPSEFKSSVTFLIFHNFNSLTFCFENPLVTKVFSPTQVNLGDFGDSYI